MVSRVETSDEDSRYLATGDEAGTAPGDRRFRPDVEGLRAVAVALVVLYHANVPRLTGGYVGVDVFFVISGFVITGLLLRERAATRRTSIVGFYARRARRIIPAATLVIVVTVLLSYPVLGFVDGNNVAVDGRWAAVFLSNFHFEAIGTDYLSASRPPSPLQNYWSLSVEEQFYVAFPLFLVLIARSKPRLSFERRLAIGLVVLIVGSFGLSVVQTSANATAAYFSPLTRAWELGLGALIAVGTGWLRRVPALVAAAITWVGMGLVLCASLILNAQSAYPGWVVAVPVLGAGLVIAGGSAAPHYGVEAILKIAPCRWLGRLSYSLYLWHWPILVLVAESAGQSRLAVSQSLWWIAVALIASVGTYVLVENPIRHARFSTRSRWMSIGLGVGLTAGTIGILTVQIDSHRGQVVAAAAGASLATDPAPASPDTVRRLVETAGQIHSVPPNLTPPVASAFFDFGLPGTWTGCSATYTETTVPSCTFGDPLGNHTVVLYGDSHAIMWAQAINDIAIRAKWKFVLLAKVACPVGLLPYRNPSGDGEAGGEWVACDQWHRSAVDRINRIDPDLLIVTQAAEYGPNGALYPPAAWQRGLEDALGRVTSKGTTKVVIGDIPRLPQSGPDCLARHLRDVQACSGPNNLSQAPYNRAELAASGAAGARYVDLAPWFCSVTCTAIIGHYDVYVNDSHITNTYAHVLEGVLAGALHLPALEPLPSAVPDLHTDVVLPAGGSTLTAVSVLDASTTDTVHVARVDFHLSGGDLRGTLVLRAAPTFFGWVGTWDTRTVANGTYRVRAVGYDVAGKSAGSRTATVVVDNP